MAEGKAVLKLSAILAVMFLWGGHRLPNGTLQPCPNFTISYALQIK